MRSVLIADPSTGLRDRLAKDLVLMNHETWLARDVRSVEDLLTLHRPWLVVTELKFRDGTWRDVLACTRAHGTCNTVILTSSGSIANAVAAVREGITNYLTKPVTAAQLIRASVDCTSSSFDDDPGPLSLDRLIWEILCQTVETSGSISAAARLLRIDRRSLRRMLQKDPPCR